MFISLPNDVILQGRSEQTTPEELQHNLQMNCEHCDEVVIYGDDYSDHLIINHEVKRGFAKYMKKIEEKIKGGKRKVAEVIDKAKPPKLVRPSERRRAPETGAPTCAPTPPSSSTSSWGSVSYTVFICPLPGCKFSTKDGMTNRAAVNHLKAVHLKVKTELF